MKITGLAVTEISAPLDRAYWMSIEPYRTASELIVHLATDEGIVGLGEIHGRPLDQIAGLIINSAAPLVIGRSPDDKDDIWNDLFSLTVSRQGSHLGEQHGQPHFGSGVRPQMMAAIAGIDIALWDVVGKSTQTPLWQALGATSPLVDCYASGGYYGPHGEAYVDEVAREMADYVALGYPAVKMKVGGLTLAEDVARVKAVRDAIGPETLLMLDANQAYSIDDAVVAAQAFEPYTIRWFEEPIQWYDSIRGLAKLEERTAIPIASGESEITRHTCRDLIELGKVSVMQFDATRAGGVTEWLRVQEHAAGFGVGMAPHHDPQIHGHMIAAAPNGLIQEVFPNTARDPLWESLFIGKPEITDGVLTLSNAPGWGWDVNPEGIARFAKRTWHVGDIDLAGLPTGN
jgi:L-alanine-DL-glutamate epimerase-like enolase superfamily enzyme